MTGNRIAVVSPPSCDVKASLQDILSSAIAVPHVGAYVVRLGQPTAQQATYVSQMVDSQVNIDTELQQRLDSAISTIETASQESLININYLRLNPYKWLYALAITPLSFECQFLVLTDERLTTHQRQQLQAITQAITSHLQLWQQHYCDQARTAELESVLNSVEHQVRQSLGLANLYLSLLEGHALNDQCRHVTHNLRATVTEIAERLTTILGQQKPPITTLPVVDLRQLVSDRGHTFAPSLQAKNLTLQIPEATVWLQADPHQIGQVVDNLLCNAIAFSPNGGGIEWTWDLFDGEVLIQIADQGPGIPAAAERDIFHPGYSRRPGGQGLGLAIVHKIIHERGGRIWVNNLTSGGAQFSVILPQTPLPQSSLGPF